MTAASGAAGSTPSASLGADYFRGVYAHGEDPWGFRTRWYELRKRAVLLAALPRERFGACVEPGCGNGELTAELADRCERVAAYDIDPTAVAAARHRTEGLAGVTVERGALPDLIPGGIPDAMRGNGVDLLVLSEVGYYFDAATLGELAGRCARSLSPDGVLVCCHWRHGVADYPLGGDEVRTRIADAVAGTLTLLGSWVDEDFWLDTWSVDPRSVAARGGLA